MMDPKEENEEGLIFFSLPFFFFAQELVRDFLSLGNGNFRGVSPIVTSLYCHSFWGSHKEAL